jgi:hypothetical protein
VKSIFLVMGACGGAAKLNHTVRSSMTQDEVLPRPSSIAWLPVPGILVVFVVTALLPGSLLLSAVTALTHIFSAAGFTVVAVVDAAPLFI